MALIDSAAATLAAGALSALGAYAAGMRSGRAQFINAVSAAANEVIKRLQEEIERLTRRCDRAEAAHAHCQDELRRLGDRTLALERAQANTTHKETT